MIIFLYGKDSYRKLAKKSEILDIYRGKYSGFSEKSFDLSQDDSVYALGEFISNVSMFDPVKLAVLENIFDCDKEKELKEIIKANLNSKDSNILISCDSPPLASYKFLLEKPVKSQEFSSLSGAKLTAFIKKEAEKNGIKLSPKEILSLAEAFQGDSWGIVTEIQKLALLNSQSERVGEETAHTTFYEAITKMRLSKSVNQRLILLETILSDLKEDPARVFNTLSYQTYYGETLGLFADYDVAVKSGKLDYEEVLLDIALL